jgi:hypothetical protein
MSQGLQVFDASGHLQFDASASLGRVIYAGPTPQSGIPNSALTAYQSTWTQVVDPAYAGRLWGILIPLFRVDGTDTKELYWPSGSISIDPVNHPGAVQVRGSWYHPDTTTNYSAGVTSYEPYDQTILVLGVY